MLITRRALGVLAAAAFAAPPTRRCSAPSGSFGAFDPIPYIAPELQKFVPMLSQMTKASLDARSLPLRRKDPLGFPPLEKPVWTTRTIPGKPGTPDIRIFIINNHGDGPPRPAVLHLHGGGFVMGAPLASLRAVQEVALALDCVAVSVDYRLAPEVPFPGPLDDNYAALNWLYGNAAKLGVDRSRIAVMGESAGGGHAAMLAIAARDHGEIPVKYQVLLYPMLDDRTGSTRQPPPFQGALIWTPKKNAFGWRSFLGQPAGSGHVPYGAVPARVEDLRGLPPAFIGVGSIDLFVDEDIEYARRLADAGVPVTLDVVPGAFHSFDIFPGHLATAFRAALVTALGDGLRAG